jgi:PAS domain S-box-containing protein
MHYQDCSAPEQKALLDAFDQHSLVSITDLAGTITYANDQFCRVSGYTRDELIGNKHSIVNSRVHAASFWKEVWSTISAGHVWIGVICNLSKFGCFYWVQTQISPIVGTNGRVEKYLSVRTDITAHKRARDAIAQAKALEDTTARLHERELYLRATLDNLPFHFWLKDADGCYLAVNQVFADECGHASPRTVVGLTDFDLWSHGKAVAFRAIDRRVIENKNEETRVEKQGAASDVRWVEVFVKPLLSGSGVVVGTVGFAQDVTDQKLAKMQLQERTEQLDAIFDLSPDGFASFDASHCVKYVSPAFTRMTGIESTHLIGLDEQGFSRVLSSRCAVASPFRGVQVLREGMLGKQPERKEFFELWLGGKRVIEVGLRLSEGSAVSQILYFRDVTHETEVDQLKSEFLSTAAHELRTPMTSILGFSEVLLTERLDDTARKELYQIIYRQSELMANVLTELLDQARIEARRGKDFVFVQTPAHALINAVVSGFKLPAGREPPVLDMPSTSPIIFADPQKAQQVILNVLANAYKYSPDGGSVRIEVLEPQGGALAPSLVGIRISDQGIGMTEVQLGRVFERFYRADTSGKILGTGLGMSIVREIVLLHGGTVDLISAPGQGTTVTLWMPMVNLMADTGNFI